MLVDYSEARFILASVVSAIASAALFTHFVTGGEWVTMQTAVLACYTAHSVLDDKLNDRNC